MTNQSLEILTGHAEHLAQSIDYLLLNGDGEFVRIESYGEKITVSALDVLRMISSAKREANALYVVLRDLPRDGAEQS